MSVWIASLSGVIARAAFLSRADAIGHPRRMTPPVMALVALLLTLAAAWLGLRLQEDRIALFWPAAGVIAGLMLVQRRGQGPAVLAGVLLALAIGNWSQGRGLAAAAVFMTGNVVQAVLVVGAMRLHERSATRHSPLAGVAAFIGATIVAAALVGAAAAVGLRDVGHASGTLGTVWLTWWSGHAIGILTVAPAVIAVARHLRMPAADRVPQRGAALVSLLVVIICWVLVGAAPADDDLALIGTLAILFPLLVLGALANAPVWPALSLLAIALVTVWHVAQAQGLFAGHVAAAQTFLFVAAMWILTFSALMAEHGRILVALRDADRRKDEFLAMLAHELRNPLAPLRNAATLLERLPSGDARIATQGALIGRQVTHLERLVNDLLDVSRINEGKITLVRAAVSVARVIDQAVELAAPHAVSRDQVIDVTPVPPDLLVHGDAVRLAQVFGNLLNNASAWSGRGDVIRVTARRAGSMVEVQVIDPGRGIDAAFLPRIFDLFSQGERGTDRAPGGLGIGLALVRSLVNLHGGSVSAASEGPGRGATFTVRLPAAG